MSKYPLKQRILTGFLIVTSFVLISGAVNYYFLQQVISKYEHVVVINMENASKMGGMRAAVYAMRSRLYYLIGFAKAKPEMVETLLKEIEEEKQKYLELDKLYSQIPFVEGEDEVYGKVSDAWKKLESATNEILSAYKAEGSSENATNLLISKYTPASYDYVKAINTLIDFQETESKKWTNDSHASAALSTTLSFVIVGASFAISIFIALLIVRRLTESLKSVISELQETSPRLSKSANDMSSLSNELATCATEQASSVQETASSLEEISAMIRRNSDNAAQAKVSTEISLQAVKNGLISIENMMTAMDDINHNNDAFNNFMAKNSEELNEMVKVIENISEKTKVIHDIVFQTKLLSFNASVEAARSGEQGKGFAVVAQEVGNLAQMSGNAANEIKGLLEESIEKVNAIVDTTKVQVARLVNDGKEKIKVGVARARECDQALTEINNKVSSVEELVAEVAHASGEQSTGITEVNKAMSQIDEVTHHNSTASQSVSTNAAEVLQLSNDIKTTCDNLVSLLNGEKT